MQEEITVLFENYYVGKVNNDGNGRTLFKSAIIKLINDNYVQKSAIRDFVVINLKRGGYEVVEAENGAAAMELYDACGGDIDVAVLDVMMPRMDGFTLAREIHKISPETPIIFLTAKTLKEDVLEGFKIGAEDYITKPFSMEELTFRIEAVLRRVAGSKNRNKNIYHIGRFEFDKLKQTLSYTDDAGTPVVQKLTTKEGDLLALFCLHGNEVVQRDYALRTIWVEDNYFNARSMDVYISKLRKLLSPDPEVEIINIHSKGYKLVTPNEEL